MHLNPLYTTPNSARAEQPSGATNNIPLSEIAQMQPNELYESTANLDIPRTRTMSQGRPKEEHAYDHLQRHDSRMVIASIGESALADSSI